MKKGILCTLLLISVIMIYPASSEAATAWFNFTPDSTTGGVSVTAEYGSPSIYSLSGSTYRVDTNYALLELDIYSQYSGYFWSSLESTATTAELLNSVTPNIDYTYPLYISTVFLHPDVVPYYYTNGVDYWYEVGTIDVIASNSNGDDLFPGNPVPFQIKVTNTPASIVPEPASMILLPIGLAIAAIRRKK